MGFESEILRFDIQYSVLSLLLTGMRSQLKELSIEWMWCDAMQCTTHLHRFDPPCLPVKRYTWLRCTVYGYMFHGWLKWHNFWSWEISAACYQCGRIEIKLHSQRFVAAYLRCLKAIMCFMLTTNYCTFSYYFEQYMVKNRLIIVTLDDIHKRTIN